ncbi:hypothetical protein IJ707_03435 [bacterium]|nr:hypothetical protein [bacterium]
MERDESYKKDRSTNPFSVPEKFKQATSPFSIDGYDTTMLEDRAYLKLDDEMLKLEYRINQLEEDLMIINDEILAAINIDDHSRIEFLQAKKTNIKKELERLNNKYFDIGAMSKFTTIMSYIFRKRSSKEKSLMQKIRYFIDKYIFAVLSKRLNFTFNLKESLSKLADINRSVDELISLRIPFGGLTGRYEKLTNYINKANDIHAQIAKNVNEFEDKKEAAPKLNSLGGLLDVSQ